MLNYVEIGVLLIIKYPAPQRLIPEAVRDKFEVFEIWYQGTKQTE